MFCFIACLAVFFKSPQTRWKEGNEQRNMELDSIDKSQITNSLTPTANTTHHIQPRAFRYHIFCCSFFLFIWKKFVIIVIIICNVCYCLFICRVLSPSLSLSLPLSFSLFLPFCISHCTTHRACLGTSLARTHKQRTVCCRITVHSLLCSLCMCFARSN